MSMKMLLTLGLGILCLLIISCEREITGSVAENSGGSEGCLNCHNGSTDIGSAVIFATRGWENSNHGSGDAMRTGSCGKCHTNEGFIAEITGEDITSDYANSVGCYTCHNPHESGEFGLRTTTAIALANGAIYDRGVSNLCVNCHQSRRDATTYVVAGKEMSGHFGPHHNNQSDMLLGENAYEYAGYDYDDDSWHTTGVTEGCITCHMDVSNGYKVGGHSFEMGPADDENTKACNVDGCHVNDLKIVEFDRVTAYDFDADLDSTEGVQTEINDLFVELETALIAAGLLEYIAEDEAYEPTAGLVVPNVDTLGAVYNWAFILEEQSHGIHNTRYAAALLISSINYLATGDPEGAPVNPGGTGRVAMRNETLSSH